MGAELVVPGEARGGRKDRKGWPLPTRSPPPNHLPRKSLVAKRMSHRCLTMIDEGSMRDRRVEGVCVDSRSAVRCLRGSDAAEQARVAARGTGAAPVVVPRVGNHLPRGRRACLAGRPVGTTGSLINGVGGVGTRGLVACRLDGPGIREPRVNRYGGCPIGAICGEGSVVEPLRPWSMYLDATVWRCDCLSTVCRLSVASAVCHLRMASPAARPWCATRSMEFSQTRGGT